MNIFTSLSLFFSSLYLNSFTCNIRITIFLSTCCNNHTVSENSQIVLYFWIFKDESCETINPRYTCYDRYKYVLLKMKIWYNMIIQFMECSLNYLILTRLTQLNHWWVTTTSYHHFKRVGSIHLSEYK